VPIVFVDQNQRAAVADEVLGVVAVEDVVVREQRGVAVVARSVDTGVIREARAGCVGIDAGIGRDRVVDPHDLRVAGWNIDAQAARVCVAGDQVVDQANRAAGVGTLPPDEGETAELGIEEGVAADLYRRAGFVVRDAGDVPVHEDGETVLAREGQALEHEVAGRHHSASGFALESVITVLPTAMSRPARNSPCSRQGPASVGDRDVADAAFPWLCCAGRTCLHQPDRGRGAFRVRQRLRQLRVVETQTAAAFSVAHARITNAKPASGLRRFDEFIVHLLVGASMLRHAESGESGAPSDTAGAVRRNRSGRPLEEV
jgi:hypothetical protein